MTANAMRAAPENVADAELLDIGRQSDALAPEVRRRTELQRERVKTATERFEAVFPRRDELLSHGGQVGLGVAREYFEREAGAYDPDCDSEAGVRELHAVEMRAMDHRATTWDGIRVKVAIAVTTYAGNTDDPEICDLLLDLSTLLNVAEGRPWLHGDLTRIAEDLMLAKRRLAGMKGD